MASIKERLATIEALNSVRDARLVAIESQLATLNLYAKAVVYVVGALLVHVSPLGSVLGSALSGLL